MVVLNPSAVKRIKCKLSRLGNVCSFEKQGQLLYMQLDVDYIEENTHVNIFFHSDSTFHVSMDRTTLDTIFSSAAL